MKYLPLFTEIRGKQVLIVGGGAIALRKARLLIDAGADLTLVSPTFERDLLALAAQSKAKLVTGYFSPEHLEHKLLVIAATDDTDVNQAVADAANAKNMLVNVVDAPALSSFIFPSIIDRSPIVVAISSGGAAPVLVRRLREKLETLLPQHLGPLASVMGKFRSKVKQTLGSLNQRRQFWEQALSSNVVSLFSQNKPEQAEVELAEQLTTFGEKENAAEQNKATRGEVYIVGGGPGDPDLLTIKALQLMQQADVVVYDGLISDEVLNLVRRDADRISVAKAAGNHSVTQDQINQMLIDLANKGHKVCRLKGGDPFIFGRGGEEAEVLVEAGIPFQIVPGITAAAGCSSYAGIPLTHRDHAQAVQFVTGHVRNDGKKDGKGPDWRSLSKPNQTLVVYMGLINSADIVSKLMANGRAGSTPVALVERGTSAKQRVMTGQLDKLVDLIKENDVISPSLIIIGEVVSLQQKLQWFGDDAINASYDQPLISFETNLETRSAA
jgi:uroporphyrin-III C-methyltransferase/precorrin-2 dehydrogenase/sirohydrochlorin ferrochelatase